MPILKKPATATPAKPGVAKVPLKTQVQQPAHRPLPPSPGGAVDAFAQRYAATDAAAGGGWVPPPPDSYNALVTEAQGVIDGEASSAYLEFTICQNVEGDESVQGKTCRMYFNFTDAEGNEATGMPYFKSAMAQFGYPDDFESWDQMVEALAAIAAAEVWAVIDVKKKGKYTNIFLSSVPENQDDKPAYE